MKKLLIFLLCIQYISLYANYFTENDSKEKILSVLQNLDNHKRNMAFLELRDMNSKESIDALYEWIKSFTNISPNGYLAIEIVPKLVSRELNTGKANVKRMLELHNGFIKKSLILGILSSNIPFNEDRVKILERFSNDNDSVYILLNISRSLQRDRNCSEFINVRLKIFERVFNSFRSCRDFNLPLESCLAFDSYEAWSCGGLATIDAIDSVLECKWLTNDEISKMKNKSSNVFFRSCMMILQSKRGISNIKHELKNIVQDDEMDIYIRFTALSEFAKYASNEDIDFLNNLQSNDLKLNCSVSMKMEWEKYYDGLLYDIESVPPSTNVTLEEYKNLSRTLRKYPLRDKASEILFKLNNSIGK